MRIYRCPQPNIPWPLRDPRPFPDATKPSATGNAGLDGYTCLSRADRQTGYSPPADPQSATQRKDTTPYGIL